MIVHAFKVECVILRGENFHGKFYTSIRASLFANSSSSLLVTDDESAVDSVIFEEEITEADSDPIVDLASLALRASLS